MAERVYHGERALVLAGEGWHEGQGHRGFRLATRFGVPTVLFAVEDGVALGSGRSVGHVDLFRALSACGDVLTRFGGHAAAAGCAHFRPRTWNASRSACSRTSTRYPPSSS
jgi:single-stranded-DNA-specific exonuclease